MLVAGREAVAAEGRASAEAEAALLVPPRYHQRLHQPPSTSHRSSSNIKPLPLTRQMLLQLPRNVNGRRGCNVYGLVSCERELGKVRLMHCSRENLIQRV